MIVTFSHFGDVKTAFYIVLTNIRKEFYIYVCVYSEFPLKTSMFISFKTRKGTRKESPNILKLSLSFIFVPLNTGQLNQYPFFVTHLPLLVSNLYVSLPVKYLYSTFLHSLSFHHLILP